MGVPVPVTHWDGVYDATQYGACCYQPRAFYDEAAAPGKAFYYNEFRKGETYTYSEDCLFLNIWAPADAAPGDRLPVIFYIHGGGFTGGCGHEKHFDGPVWPTKGCVAVTINYRLGPMGFVCLPELADEPDPPATMPFWISWRPCSGCAPTSLPLAAMPTTSPSWARAPVP